MGSTQIYIASATNDTEGTTGQMKTTGPVCKATPVAKTQKRICAEAPAGLRRELHQLLEDFSALFPENLQKGKPPKREVEFEIKTEEGTVPPNKPPYRLSSKEHEELQARSMIC